MTLSKLKHNLKSKTHYLQFKPINHGSNNSGTNNDKSDKLQ